MDLSIACALYFAARGEGDSQTQPQADAQPYSTTARVLLSGLGADELFGGYGRHGVAYKHRGYSGLVEELELDVGRLGRRNLGRDDRVMAHWGREVRFPFLDERFVKWAVETPVWEKCDFENKGDLDPEKRVLRLLARNLGMTSVAQEKKRAVSVPFILKDFLLTAMTRSSSVLEPQKWRVEERKGQPSSRDEVHESYTSVLGSWQ